MKRTELLEKIAPCSLMCHTCSAYANGQICKSAKHLLKYLEGIKEFYEKHNPEQAEHVWDAVMQNITNAVSKGALYMNVQ